MEIWRSQNRRGQRNTFGYFSFIGYFSFLALIPPAACGLSSTLAWFIPGFRVLGLQMCAGGSPDTPLCLFCGQPPPDPAQRHSRYDISTTTRAPIGQQRLFSWDGTGMPLCLGSRGNFVYLVLNVVSRGKIGESFFFSPGRQATDSGTIFLFVLRGKRKDARGIYIDY